MPPPGQQQLEERPKGSSLRPLKAIVPLLRPYFGTLALAIVVLLAAAATTAIFPFAAESLIDAVDAAAHLYPWKQTYRAFPGPNSNTFIAWIAQQVPALELELPFSAIGSGYVTQAEN